MPTVNIVASDTIAVNGQNTVYADARTTSYDEIDTASYNVGQMISGGTNYIVSRGFLKFDTSSIHARAKIYSLKLQLTATVDNSGTDFDVQIVKQNWAAQDPITSTPATPIAYVAYSSAMVASGNMTPAEPAGTAQNDILICLITQKDNVAPAMSADWTQIYSVPNAASMLATAFWCRRGASPPSYLITRAAGNSGTAIVAAYRNCITTGSPIRGYGTQITTPSGVTVTHPALINTSIDTHLLAILHAANDDMGSAAWTANDYTHRGGAVNSLGTTSATDLWSSVNTAGDIVAHTLTENTAGLHIGAIISLAPITTMEPAYDNCLAGTADDNIWRNTSGMAINTPYQSGELNQDWITRGGITYYSLRSSRDFAGTTSSASELIQIAKETHATAAYRPTLIVTYRDPTPQINII